VIENQFGGMMVILESHGWTNHECCGGDLGGIDNDEIA